MNNTYLWTEQMLKPRTIMRRIWLLLALSAYCLTGLGQDSNVDTYVAVTDLPDNNTFAIIISNEHYKHEVEVQFALNDGAVFQRYLTKTLGVPEKNIKFVPDASLNDMNYNLKWLENVMNVKDGEARAIVYYSGHGMPDDDSKKAYLLPIDGYSSEPTSGLSTESLYKRLGTMKSRQTLVFLDACFSGAKRDGGMMQSACAVAIKAKKDAVNGNMVIFSATEAGQTAYPLKSKEHGLFTYYILESLQKSGGCITLGELSDRVTKLVNQAAVIENEKPQTPTINAGADASDWRNWQFASEAAKRYETMSRPKVAMGTTTPSVSQQPTNTPPAQNKNKHSFVRRNQ